jgi:hypothetical protein
MKVQRDVTLLAAEGRDVEQKIKAVEEWNNLLLEKAKRVELYSYWHSKKCLKKCPIRDRSFLYGLRTSCFLDADDNCP